MKTNNCRGDPIDVSATKKNTDPDELYANDKYSFYVYLPFKDMFL